MNRWSRLFNQLKEQNELPSWFSLFHQRLETGARVTRDIASMSPAYFPHGGPPISRMDGMIANDPYNFAEDVLLEILFHTDEYWIGILLYFISK